MTCPNCKVGMEKGSLMAHGQFWTNRSGKFLRSIVGFIAQGLRVTANRCPDCGKIELYTEAEKK